MKKNKIYLTGHTGLLGSAIYRVLKKKKKYTNTFNREKKY